MIIKQHSLVAYFALTFALFWGSIAVGRIPRFGFFAPIAGALAPGVAALVITGIAEGEHGVRALVRRLAHWRVAPIWYVIALGLPIAGWLIAVAVATPGYRAHAVASPIDLGSDGDERGSGDWADSDAGTAGARPCAGAMSWSGISGCAPLLRLAWRTA